ncbi:MAG TPA: DUF1269 domain-containing protein [Anaerolineae bacterium]|nr:DUF1269 domain-containing protein [Anaerolineae bacterium]
MNDPTVQVILAVFDDENSTEAALKQLKAAKKGEPRVQAAVAMFKDADGSRFRYKEVGLTPGKGALGGVILGATLGILTGGATIILGAAGALLGGLVGRKKQESRLPTDRINQVVASLPAGSSAILAVVADQDVAAVEKDLADLGADLLTVPISADIAAQLMEHKDAAHAALRQELGPEPE